VIYLDCFPGINPCIPRSRRTRFYGNQLWWRCLCILLWTVYNVYTTEQVSTFLLQL